MQLLFVDESGTSPTKEKAQSNPYFVLGAIAIPEDIWAKVAADFARIKDNFDVVGEIKWRNFSRDKENNKPHALSHLDGDLKNELRSQLFQLINNYKSIKLISVVVDTVKAYELSYINDGNDIYFYAYKVMTERFQYYLQDLERTVGQKINGIVVCDHRAPNDDTKLRELHYNLMNSTKGVVSKYDNIVEGLFIAPSHLSIGIQFADLVAGAIYRKFSANDDRFYDQISSSLRTSPTGQILGYGLAKIPRTW